MATHSMIKKTMTITSLAILVAVISVAATMTMVQAVPIGDMVDISVTGATPTVGGPYLVVTPAAEYTGEFTAPAFPITVNLEDGTVWIDVDAGVPAATGVIVIDITGIEWFGLGPTEDGAITALSCEIDVDSGGPVALPSALFNKDSVKVTVDTTAFELTPFEVHCTFTAVHGDLDKTETCPETAPLKAVTACTITIIYTGAPANVRDTVPAEWEVTAITNNGAADTCEDATRGKSGKSATKINCDDATDVNTTLDISTRASPENTNPNKPPKFKPTSCEPLPINDGVVATAVDGSGDPIIGTLDGLPIVIVETGPLPPITVVDNDPFFCIDE